MSELSGVGCDTHIVQCRLVGMDGRMFSEIHCTKKGSDVLLYEISGRKWECLVGRGFNCLNV